MKRLVDPPLPLRLTRAILAADTMPRRRLFLDATSADMHRGQWVDPEAGRLTLAEWTATYLATVTNLRPTTLATYERDLTRYVLPRFGHLPLARIRPLDVRGWLADELAAGIAPTSVHRHFCTLRRLLRVAVETDLLVKSPCAGIKPRRSSRSRCASSPPRRSTGWQRRCAGLHRRLRRVPVGRVAVTLGQGKKWP